MPHEPSCFLPPGKIPVKEDLAARIGQIEERLAVRRDLAAQASWPADALCMDQSTLQHACAIEHCSRCCAALRLLLQTSMLAVFLSTCRKTRCWRSWSG